MGLSAVSELAAQTCDLPLGGGDGFRVKTISSVRLEPQVCANTPRSRAGRPIMG